MKKNINNIFALIGLGILLGFAGCSESVEPKPLTYTQLLTGTTSKAWRLTALQLIEPDKEPYSFTIPNNCEFDDHYVFYADQEKKFEIQEGASKCNPNDPTVYVESTWSFVNATATINFPLLVVFYFPVNISSFNFTVKRLTDRSMTLEYYDTIDNYTLRFVFTAQGE